MLQKLLDEIGQTEIEITITFEDKNKRIMFKQIEINIFFNQEKYPHREVLSSAKIKRNL